MAALHCRAFGPHALLVEVGSAAEAGALAAWARALGPSRGIEARDIVPAATTVLFDGLVNAASIEALREALAGWSPVAEMPPGPVVELPTTYDGPDLAGVAELWGVEVAEVVRRHTSLEFTSAFCGFAPGFAYLTGLPPEWEVPRLAAPRPRVPTGAVGIAGPFCGVYPSASPGGWRLLGHTAEPLWDLTRPRPALLEPGTRVRFREVS